MATRTRVLAAVAALLAVATAARGGHELAVYPSYYPHEIAIETVLPERAAGLLRDGKIHAYLGAEPLFPGGVPATIRAVESLGSIVALRLNPAAPWAKDEASACAVAATIIRSLAGASGFVFHPYPVTPFHGDYLYHVDRAEAAKARFLEAPAGPAPPSLKIAAGGALAGLVRPEWRASGPDSRRGADRQLPKNRRRLYRQTPVFHRRLQRRDRERRLRCDRGPQFADVHSHGEAEELSVERLAGAGHASAGRSGLEPDRRL
jgi:hypothetical protein